MARRFSVTAGCGPLSDNIDNTCSRCTASRRYSGLAAVDQCRTTPNMAGWSPADARCASMSHNVSIGSWRFTSAETNPVLPSADTAEGFSIYLS
jgi:hypothetical protein